MSKAKLSAIVAVLLALLGAAKLFLDSAPAAAPVAPSAVSADAGAQ